MATDCKNDVEIEHRSAHGTMFRAEHGDLIGGVVVTTQWDVTPLEMMEDFAEWGAFHAMHIWPHLNGFQGYDTVTYIHEHD